MRVYVNHRGCDFEITESHRCFIEQRKPGMFSVDQTTGYFQIDNLSDMQSLLELQQGWAVEWRDFNFRLVKVK
jgi:hypothetical protein